MTVVLVSFATYQAAAEETQYPLKVSSEPNILFLSGGGFYKAGTVVTTDKAPGEWQSYKFVCWQIDGKCTEDNPVTVRMDRAYTVTAMYVKNDVAKITIDAIPRIAEVTVNDNIYLPSELPVTVTIQKGKEFTVTVSDVIEQDPSNRYVFDMWKDLDQQLSRTMIAETDMDLKAIYKTQYQLKAITEYGTASGYGWKDKGSTAEFRIDNSTVLDKESDQIRYVFDGWDKGDYKNSPTNFIDIEEPTTIIANWKQQYKLELLSSVPSVSIYGGGWHNKGKTVALIAEEELESEEANAKYVFDRWVSVGPNSVIIPNPKSPLTTVTMDAPYYIEAKYKKSYLVSVFTPYGTATGNGFYAEGATAEIKIVTPEVVTEQNKVKKVFAGWDYGTAKVLNPMSGKAETAQTGQSQQTTTADGQQAKTQNLLIVVEQPTVITAKWKSQYYLDVQSAQSKATGTGWYEPGSMVMISANAPSTPPGMWSAHVFKGWEGDFTGKSSTAKIIVDDPKIVVAEWEESYIPGVINSLVLGGIGAVGMTIYSKTRKKTSKVNGNGENNPFLKSSLYRDVSATGMVIYNKIKNKITSHNNENEKTKDRNDDNGSPYINKSSKYPPAGIA